jgi:hypothetical protein
MHTVPYVSAVGTLMYLAIATRPDIAFAVGVLCRFMANPGPEHWKAVKHLFHYLCGVDTRVSVTLDSPVCTCVLMCFLVWLCQVLCLSPPVPSAMWRSSCDSGI